MLLQDQALSSRFLLPLLWLDILNMALQTPFPSRESFDWGGDFAYGAVSGGCSTALVEGEFEGCSFHFLQQQQHWNVQEQSTHALQALLASHPFAARSCKTSNNTARLMVAAHEDKETLEELDHYLRVQSEKLRLVVQEQRKRQATLVFKSLETRALPLLRQKDWDIAQAANRASQLEDYLRKLEMENQEWQRAAQENQAMVISLSNAIEQLREKPSCCHSNGIDDAESCCDEFRADEGREGEFEYDNEKGRTMICYGCQCRNSCMLFLPCRHLSSCKLCEEVLDRCPVCQTAKASTIEALMG